MLENIHEIKSKSK